MGGSNRKQSDSHTSKDFPCYTHCIDASAKIMEDEHRETGSWYNSSLRLSEDLSIAIVVVAGISTLTLGLCLVVTAIRSKRSCCRPTSRIYSFPSLNPEPHGAGNTGTDRLYIGLDTSQVTSADLVYERPRPIAHADVSEEQSHQYELHIPNRRSIPQQLDINQQNYYGVPTGTLSTIDSASNSATTSGTLGRAGVDQARERTEDEQEINLDANDGKKCIQKIGSPAKDLVDSSVNARENGENGEMVSIMIQCRADVDVMVSTKRCPEHNRPVLTVTIQREKKEHRGTELKDNSPNVITDSERFEPSRGMANLATGELEDISNDEEIERKYEQ